MPTFPDLITVISKIGPTVAVAAAPIYIVLYGELEFRYPRNRPPRKPRNRWRTAGKLKRPTLRSGFRRGWR
jgi:hypothetical protein